MGGPGMYGFEPPDPVRLWDLELLEACPASAGPPSQLPKPQLDRWKGVEQAIVDWHVQGEPESRSDIADICDRLFSGWDPVQRRMLEDLFAAYRRLHPSGSRVDLEPDQGVFVDPNLNLSLRVGVQVEVETEAGWEAVRIKTGRKGTSSAEAAAFYTSDDKALVDVMLAEEDRVPVPRPDRDEAAGLLQELFDRYTRATAQERVRRPGLHCYSCRRPARCGQYPLLGGDVSYRTRTVRVSKSQLGDLDRCHRSAAWPFLFGIPKDPTPPDETVDSPGLRVGNLFHETVAAALLSDNPEELFDAACSKAPPSEAADLRYLFDQHVELWAGDPFPVDPTRTEYQMGVTLVVPGQIVDSRDNLEEGPVAVVMMGKTDVNGWETSNTAAVVEHRTGTVSSPGPHEPDLYAVSAWTALQQMRRDADGVAVHFHHLRRSPAQCERIHYTPDQIQAAITRLTDVAGIISGWHPTNALTPEYTIGPQCDWCERRERCQQNR